MFPLYFFYFFFFFNDTATTEIYTLSLHDALPISPRRRRRRRARAAPARARRGRARDRRTRGTRSRRRAPVGDDRGTRSARQAAPHDPRRRPLDGHGPRCRGGRCPAVPLRATLRQLSRPHAPGTLDGPAPSPRRDQ